MTFGVPSGRTQGVNIPDRGSASPEYALYKYYKIDWGISQKILDFRVLEIMYPNSTL